MRNDLVLRFIKIFQSEANISLFTDCACYWFAVVLHQRFSGSTIVYNPSIVHFATKIGDKVYDITGLVDDSEDYLNWSIYKKSHPQEADMVMTDCINMIGE